MDLLKCATASVLEAAFLFHFGAIQVDELPYTCLVLAFVQYLAIKLFYVFIWPFYFSPLRHLPGPKDGRFLLGQLYNQSKSLPSELEKKWMRDYPDAPFIRYLSLFNKEILMVNSPAAHKEVLQTQCYSFVKPKYYERVVGEIAGHGILFTEGDEHKKQRRLLIRMKIPQALLSEKRLITSSRKAPFSFGNIKRLLPFFQVKARETSSIISRTLKESNSNVIEVSGLLAKTTLDIVGVAALGYELNSLSSSSILAESYEKIFEFVTPLQILISLVHRYIPIRKWLPLKANRDYVNANLEVRQRLRQHIRQRKQEFREGKIRGEKSSRDLLTLMIEESKDTWSEDEMLGYLLNFMSAYVTRVSGLVLQAEFPLTDHRGHETTAGSLTWALYALTLHPELQVRLRDEIRTNITTESPSYADLEKLRLLNNFTKEVLRYYPPAPSFPREAIMDLTIEGINIPKGSLLTIAPAAPQFNQHIWGPTADQFDPDRYDNLPVAAQDPYASEAFSSGPRVCIGKSFALLEFKTIMCELLRNFEFENTGPVEPQKSGPSLRPKAGMKLKVRAV